VRGVDVVRRGPERVRVVPWRGDPAVAHVTPLGEAPPVTAAMVRHCCGVLADRGYHSVLTGALARREQQGFLEDGFAVHEELHLLAHDLADLPELAPLPEGVRLRRGHRWDRSRTLDVDRAAFPPFWRLDAPGLEEALAATPQARYRVAAGREVVGYAVAGRAGPRGYLQRLAVAPAASGEGVGTALVGGRPPLDAGTPGEASGGEHPGGQRAGAGAVPPPRLPPPAERARRPHPAPR
jgi:GNAT superfamily N-acetyltransferase